MIRISSSPTRAFLFWGALALLALVSSTVSPGEPSKPTRKPLSRTVDLNIGESQQVTLSDGTKATVQLRGVEEIRDNVCDAVREARVSVEVNDVLGVLISATYHLPLTVAGVRIDCPITKGYMSNSNEDPWGLEKDARIRLWPAGSPLLKPGTFVYPAKQRWFASDTQMANEPVFVDGGEVPKNKRIYYHWGLDVGGAEGLVEVVAAADGVIASSGKETMKGVVFPENTVKPRYDVVYLRDGRGWYHRYSHLHTIDAAIRPGVRVKMGQRIGLLGKEGGSGGWSHLHFDLSAMQPSGRYGIVEAYAFYWQAYRAEHAGEVIAVARPHHFTPVGRPVTLDGSRSAGSSAAKPIVGYEWIFGDGSRAQGPTVVRTYDRPGVYSEILKVTDAAGKSDYDFAVVQVIDPQQIERLPPSIHAVYWPTEGLKAGQEITFKVRSFRVRPEEGCERWDFGDGSPAVEVRSDGNAVKLAKDGYAVTKHRYARAGDYLVSVWRANERGEKATARLHVRVE